MPSVRMPSVPPKALGAPRRRSVSTEPREERVPKRADGGPSAGRVEPRPGRPTGGGNPAIRLEEGEGCAARERPVVDERPAPEHPRQHGASRGDVATTRGGVWCAPPRASLGRPPRRHASASRYVSIENVGDIVDHENLAGEDLDGAGKGRSSLLLWDFPYWVVRASCRSVSSLILM